MVRSSLGVREGSWYFEIECLPHQGNTRLGWSTAQGDVQAPVGFDRYRDKAGDVFHQSRGKPYGSPYGPGDIVGLLIDLPPLPKGPEKEPEKVPEVPGAPPAKPEEKIHPGSSITFYLNGKSQGVAFQDLWEGLYYPAASLYMGGKVKFHFLNFSYPIPPGARPMAEAPVPPPLPEIPDPMDINQQPPTVPTAPTDSTSTLPTAPTTSPNSTTSTPTVPTTETPANPTGPTDSLGPTDPTSTPTVPTVDTTAVESTPSSVPSVPSTSPEESTAQAGMSIHSLLNG